MDFETLAAAEADLLLLFVFKVLSAEYDISSSGKVRAAAKVFKDKGAAPLASRTACV